jgi:hypothetical protein
MVEHHTVTECGAVPWPFQSVNDQLKLRGRSTFSNVRDQSSIERRIVFVVSEDKSERDRKSRGVGATYLAQQGLGNHVARD